MKRLTFTLLAAVLLIAATPVAKAQEKEHLTAIEAHQLLRRLSGSWLVTRYAWHPQSETFYQTTGEADISHADLGSYLHEQNTIKLVDGSKRREERFLGYSAEKGRFELIQTDEQSNNTTLMVGQWHPEYDAITLTNPDGLKKESPNNIEYVYVFLPENVLLKLVRALDKRGFYLILSQEYLVPRHTADLR